MTLCLLYRQRVFLVLMQMYIILYNPIALFTIKAYNRTKVQNNVHSV